MSFHVAGTATPRGGRKTAIGSHSPRSQSPRRRPSDASRDAAADKLRAENEKQRKLIEEQQRQIEALKTAAALGTEPSKANNRGDATDALRTKLLEYQAQVDRTQAQLQGLLPEMMATSRAGYLRSLPELIGSPPEDPMTAWKDEWIQLKAEAYRLSGQGEATVEEDLAYVREHDNFEKFVAQGWVQDDIKALMQKGWTYKRAECYTMLFTCLEALARAMNESDKCYVASTYALCEALFAQRRGAGEHAGSKLTRQLSAVSDASLRSEDKFDNLYSNRTGLYGLTDREARWENLEIPDGTGFRGLTTSALTHATSDERYFSEEGFLVIVDTDAETGEPLLAVAKNSDIICFESAPDDEHGAHSAVETSHSSGDFPPNTLFRFKEVREPGSWEAPGGVYPKQRLIVVTATYQPPNLGVVASDEGGRMCGSPVTLSYNKRETFLRGLDDMIAKPALTMEDEFLRPMSWHDWAGVEYNLRTEWAYVNSKAQRTEKCTPGTRDEHNDGKTPEAFLEEANRFIQERRDKGHGALLPREHALLTRDEVLAVRLYSGPAYQPINMFLRQIAPLTDQFRKQVAEHPDLTFACTVGHICRAIRKLAAVGTPDEAKEKLYRGVRGDLEKAFWLPDSQGMVCAVDMAFMSTSRMRETPVQYMQKEGPNVLWCLHPKTESDGGFHRGASIELLSQFAGEKEVLFPPCTMLIVREKDRGSVASAEAPPVARLSSAAAEDAWAKFAVEQVCEQHKDFLSVDVLPVFL